MERERVLFLFLFFIDLLWTWLIRLLKTDRNKSRLSLPLNKEGVSVMFKKKLSKKPSNKRVWNLKKKKFWEIND